MSETFDLLDAVTGISYPETTVSLYMNLAAIRNLEAIDEALKVANGEEEENELFSRRSELLEAVRKSALHIELKGVPRAIVSAMTKKIVATIKDRNEQADTINKQFLLKSIVKVMDSEGREANFDDEALEKFLGALREPDYDRLLQAANELSFQTLKYENKVTDPNFS